MQTESLRKVPLSDHEDMDIDLFFTSVLSDAH